MPFLPIFGASGSPPADDTPSPAAASPLPRSPLRAAAAALMIAMAPPPDAGTTCVPDCAPDIARAPAARPAAYQLLIGTPPDAGTAGVADCSPDLAGNPPTRAAAYALAVAPMPADEGFVGARAGKPKSPYLYHPLAEPGPYALVVGTPRDAGAAVQDPGQPSPLPGRAPAASRAAATAYRLLIGTPPDAGMSCFAGSAPDLARGSPRRPAAHALVEGTPPDAGAVSFADSAPDLARGPTPRTAAYALLVGAPGDQGIVITPPPVAAETPDFARGSALRIAAHALSVAAPRDAGLSPVPAQAPDLARGPAARLGTYELLIGTPPDAGLPPVPDCEPDLARGPSPRPAGYSLVVAAPRDAGLTQPIVPATWPDRAPPPQRAGVAGYAVSVPAPRDSGFVSGSWPISDAFTGTGGTLLSAHTPDTGGFWTLHPSYSGTAQLDAANRLRQTSTTAACYYADAAPTSPDYEVSVDGVALSTTAFADTAGVVGRLDTAADTCYSAREEQGSGTWTLVRRVAGSETSLGTSATPAVVVGTPQRLTLRMVGTTISLVVDGVTKISATDSAISAAGRAGVRFTSVTSAPTDTTLLHLDNFATAEIQVPVFPPQPVPDRAAGWLRPATTAYGTPLSPTPLDAGSAPVGPETPDLAPGRARAASSAYLVTLAPPPDAGSLPVPGATPDRAATAARAASSAYQLPRAVPLDAGAQPVPASLTDLARGAALRAAAYPLLVGAPRDAGLLPVPTSAPDRAAGPPQRPASYTLIVGAPGDQGVVLTPPPVAPAAPDRAAAAFRLAAFAPFATPAPRDGGLAAVAPAAPDRASGLARASSSVYLVAVGTPADAGLPPVPPTQPDRASGPSRAASATYLIVTGTPRDSGIAATDPPILVAMPVAAPGPRRPAVSTSVALASATPRDAGLLPTPTQAPDRAAGPRRPAAPAHLIATGTPRDQGTTPIPASAPQRADRARPAGLGAYEVLTGTPPDLGSVPGPIAAQYPARAPGPRRAASSAYTILVLPPRDAGAGIVYRVYANAGSGPIDYTTVVATTELLTWTSAALAFPDAWRFGVRAYNAATALGERNVDAVLNLTLDAAGVDVTAMPDAPTGLSGHASAAGAIVLDWTYALVDPARAPTGFRVYRGTGGVVSYASPVATVAYTRGTVHGTATVAGGTDGVAYTFGVRAYNATGEEANVATTTVTADATAPAAVLTFTGVATA